MYSPTTRLLTVLQLLQSYKEMSGSELARRLEIDVRTVRRYIVMLQDMGIPVEAERGPYGAYQLGRGYKLPPLMYTDAEVIALTLGLLAIREFRFPVDVAAVEGALAKTERVMPEKLLQQARGLQEAITFNVQPQPTIFQNEFVTILSSAVQQRHHVFLNYLSWRGDKTERDFDPYGILFHDGYWYTSGYCHLRNDLRTFRLDRILELKPTEQPFERPEEFDVLAHVLDALATTPGLYQVEVLMKTTLEHAHRVFSPAMGTLEETDQGILFRRATDRLDWIAYIFLRCDFPVRVLQPDALRTEIRGLAEKALRMIDTDEPSTDG
ncbi:MAG: YafY family transcriptional regulator [Anaerolineae bacterium]|nr:YafY family transcriptional regulator [Anaerolineae bacterium]